MTTDELTRRNVTFEGKAARSFTRQRGIAVFAQPSSVPPLAKRVPMSRVRACVRAYVYEDKVRRVWRDPVFCTYYMESIDGSLHKLG